MIEMNEPRQTQLARAVQVAQNMCERGRIRTARDRGQHAALGPDEIVLTHESADAGEQIHDLNRPPSLKLRRTAFAWLASRPPPRVALRRTRSWLAGRSSAKRSEGWCRGPDSNRRPRAYETRALTN